MRNQLAVSCAFGLVLGACDSGAPGTNCSGAVNAVLHVARAKPEEATAKVKQALLARCAQDKWSPEAATCMRNASTAGDQLDCRHQHLTGAQDEGFATAMDGLHGGVDAVSAIEKMAKFRDKMCECADADCAKRVADKMTNWSSVPARSSEKEPPKMTEAQMKRATEIGTQMGECMQRAMGMGVTESNAQNPKGLKDALDREAISKGIRDVKANITSCGDNSTAKGKVKVKVKVSPDGTVASVSVETTPDKVLGACVATQVQKATFEETANGGSFSYPFIF